MFATDKIPNQVTQSDGLQNIVQRLLSRNHEIISRNHHRMLS